MPIPQWKPKNPTIGAQSDDNLAGGIGTQSEKEICTMHAVGRRDMQWEEDGSKCVLQEEGQIHEIQGQGRWVSLGKGEVTVDSAADESCWPENMGGAFEVRRSKRNIRLMTANGAEMKHLGKRM